MERFQCREAARNVLKIGFARMRGKCIMSPGESPALVLGKEIDSEMTTLSNVTVLILDDNPLVLKLGRALLEREGCTVLTASSWIEFNHVLAGNTPDI